MRPRHKILAVTLVILLLASCTASYFIGKASFTGSLENLPWYAGAPIEHSYIVTTNTTNFFCFNGTTGRLELTTTNSSAAIMNALNNVTTEGGSVFVKSGVYSATVILKNNTRLVLDKGTAGITVSIDTGATCIFEDYNAGISWWYSAGTLVMQHNNLNGLITGTFSSFTQYYSAGLNRTDAVVNPITSCSYIIDKSGSTYRLKNGTTGQIDYSSTNSSTVERFADGNLTSGGSILIRTAVYNTDVGWYIHKYTQLIFEAATKLNVTGNANAITIDYGSGLDPDICWAILGNGLNISMNQKLGNGIYATEAGSKDNKQVSRIEDVIIHDVAVGYAGINLTDPLHIIIANIKIRTFGTGIFFGVNDSKTMWYGDGTELNQINIGFLGNNVCGINVTSGTTYGLNYMSWNEITLIDSSPVGVGTVGLFIRGLRHSSITKLVAEYLTVGVDIGDSGGIFPDAYDIDFFAPSIQRCNPDCFWVQDGAYGINIHGGRLEAYTGALAYNNTDAAGYSSRVIGTRLEVNALPAGGSGVVGTGNVVFRECSGYVTEVWSSEANCVNGTWIEHGLAGTPDLVLPTLKAVSTTYDNPTIYVRWCSQNSTHWQVSLIWSNGTIVDASHSPRTVYYYAYFDP